MKSINIHIKSTVEYMMNYSSTSSTENVTVINCNTLCKTMQRWEKSLPSVVPHYAVKCNPHPCMIEQMMSLGSGFDCASPAEIRAVLKAGAKPSQIIYANAMK